MERKVGTVSRGIRCPIIREGDNLVDITVNSVIEAAESEGFELRDRDVVALTESIVARAQGNYATIQNIADDVKAKLGGETIGVIFPILSRNRFAICLKGIAMGAKKVVLMLSYPSDEVGNALLTYDQLDGAVFAMGGGTIPLDSSMLSDMSEAGVTGTLITLPSPYGPIVFSCTEAGSVVPEPGFYLATAAISYAPLVTLSYTETLTAETRAIAFGTMEMTDGVTALPSGVIYLQVEG